MTEAATLAQYRVLAEQAADIALTKYLAPVSEPKVEIPAPMKWAAGIISAVMTAAVVGIFVWLVGTVNTMQQTLVRIDERQRSQVENLDSRFADNDRRIRRLEGFHNLGGQ
ncbi:hypothetical protein FIM10_01780 [Sphingomonadales bacterium 56]|uniref:hypothetical protein n=1 Tax=unclassified Sphingobium TaxID=2611147 RepID=UPI00191ABE51|nr:MULTISPECIES: hypothetical protein [unclassified Sphingobium]MBY2927413.1 hypothetical protein [Sphingomonadales bacterium 56]MBY2957481.1 hypothetical protein [Sphingomonadales bacterium 58]MBY2957524.1 hypothetical protein [Sphingomonadales bacterium 58]CAD7335141.1 hypothetical protein SPHS8_00358 [Sphingobium sp. S8]CAD7335160.1 hypothetical protein SPHS6_00358 [Sphingobium sp. S6]